MDLPPSTDQLQLLVMERIEPAQNCQRYYVLSVNPTLFGGAALTREWGRLGRRGRLSVALYADPETAREALEVWLRRKQTRGYRPIFTKVEVEPVKPEA